MMVLKLGSTRRHVREQMKPLVLSVLITTILVVQPCQAATQTLTFDTVNDIDTVTFDPSRIPENQLRELIVYSPYIVDYLNDMPSANFSALGSMIGAVPDKHFAALPLERCITGDPEYRNCGTNDIVSQNFLHNAQFNLERSKRGLAWIQHLNHPSELNSVANYLERWLSASIWIEEARLKYYSSGEERGLKEVHDGVDPGALCSDVFTKLATARSKEEKYRIVRFDWANCVLKAFDRKLGPYPVNEWNAFLKAYGITETYKQKSPD